MKPPIRLIVIEAFAGTSMLTIPFMRSSEGVDRSHAAGGVCVLIEQDSR